MIKPIDPTLVYDIINEVDGRNPGPYHNITREKHPKMYNEICSLVQQELYVDKGDSEPGFTVIRYEGCHSTAKYIHCDSLYGIDPGEYVNGYNFPRQMAFIATLAKSKTNCITSYWTLPEFTLTNFTQHSFDLYLKMMHLKFTQFIEGKTTVTYSRPSTIMEKIIKSFEKHPLMPNTISNLPYFHFHVGPETDSDEPPRYFLRARYHPLKVPRPTMEVPRPTMDVPPPTMDVPPPTMEVPQPTMVVPQSTMEGGMEPLLRGSTQPHIRSRRSRVKRRKRTRGKASHPRRSRRRMIRRSSRRMIRRSPSRRT